MLLSMMEPATNEGGKKRPSLPAQETHAEKKPKTSSATHEGSPATPNLVIDLTSFKAEKEEAARSVSVVPTIPKVTSSIADKIAQRRSSSLPPVLKCVPKRPSETKSGSPLERLAIMKSDKVPLPAKVAPKLVPSAAKTDSFAEKKVTTRAGSCEKSTKSVSKEVVEI
ncbi:hypothetical protein ACFX10_022631 [Malus domestica]